MADKPKYDHDVELKKIKDDFFQQIQDHLLKNFEPLEDLSSDPNMVLMTTREIFEALQRLFPSGIYKMDDVAVFMNAAGFKFVDVNVMQWEWVMKKKK